MGFAVELGIHKVDVLRDKVVAPSKAGGVLNGFTPLKEATGPALSAPRPALQEEDALLDAVILEALNEEKPRFKERANPEEKPTEGERANKFEKPIGDERAIMAEKPKAGRASHRKRETQTSGAHHLTRAVPSRDAERRFT